METYAQEIEPTRSPGEEDSTKNPMDDLGDVTDAFQENFFEGLKQKGIENYELAITALNKAEKATSSEENKAVVYFELAKNYTYLKDFDQAEKNFKKVLNSQGDRLDVLEHLYDLYYQARDYEKAIPLVQKLIPFDEDYKEDLANLYTHNKQYDEALALLDQLDESWGESDIRNALRVQIYRVTGNTKGAIENIEQKIESNPKNEKEYLSLIFLYSEQGNSGKAFEAAKQLLKANPKSELVHLALYKFYLESNNAEEAIKSMKIVFSSNDIDKETKYKVLGDFLHFVEKNPEYENQLSEVVNLFSEKNGRVFEKLGDYYLVKGRKQEALESYEKGIAKDPDNYNLLKNTLLLQIDFRKYEAAQKLSAEGLEIFPAQALLYLLNGVANNGLQRSDTAIESLETGLDFIFEDPTMESDFYEQLSHAYATKGDTQKAKQFSEKATSIKTSN
jgi:tetratricopeptide (TPR) repeat protein